MRNLGAIKRSNNPYPKPLTALMRESSVLPQRRLTLFFWIAISAIPTLGEYIRSDPRGIIHCFDPTEIDDNSLVLDAVSSCHETWVSKNRERLSPQRALLANAKLRDCSRRHWRRAEMIECLVLSDLADRLNTCVKSARWQPAADAELADA